MENKWSDYEFGGNRMDEEKYLIGEVSKITGLSKDTIHFYVNYGLLTPDHIDPNNGYRYYSRWNLWQLDIITICRKLSIPLEQIKEILASHDNSKITKLLLEYRREALRLSAYFKQVAEDIAWYDKENSRIQNNTAFPKGISLKWLDEEVVIAGMLKRDKTSYHANLLEAAKDELRQADTIQRQYGYILDLDQIRNGKFVKQREYLKIAGNSYHHVKSENLYTIPAGNYAVFILHIENGNADFSPLLSWLDSNAYHTDMIYAEEIGLQLFDYVEYDCEIKAHLI